MAELVAPAPRRVRLHFDAWRPRQPIGPQLCDEFLDGPAELSYTLPGRWRRSWTTRLGGERGMTVRMVKGQWPDPADPKRDLRQGYLEVIDALAGRARHVAVATHDVPLGRRLWGGC